ncbi:MAG: hypothetical protein HN341_19850 [Verrucomicrobia bacterium]|jgi:hypothetical protein|nr:hypothetical protein [Verrucomicrobiota bacterium]
MPLYKHMGVGPIRIGCTQIHPGDTVVAGEPPRGDFVLVKEEAPPQPADLPEEAPEEGVEEETVFQPKKKRGK